MTVVAEGVETAEQLACLNRLGCDYGQGYFFAEPLDSQQATELILNARSHRSTTNTYLKLLD
ncbi:MAG: EAL domain-containing protein [Pseudanabaena sp. RU_4_16]|nr:EAL domain-containing protein [Pseudanabaena sp. RU_4_16]